VTAVRGLTMVAVPYTASPSGGAFAVTGVKLTRPLPRPTRDDVSIIQTLLVKLIYLTLR